MILSWLQISLANRSRENAYWMRPENRSEYTTNVKLKCHSNSAVSLRLVMMWVGNRDGRYNTDILNIDIFGLFSRILSFDIDVYRYLNKNIELPIWSAFHFMLTALVSNIICFYLIFDRQRVWIYVYSVWAWRRNAPTPSVNYV